MSRTAVWVVLGFVLGIGVVAIYMIANPKPSINTRPTGRQYEAEEASQEVSEEEMVEVTIKMSEYIFTPSVVSVDANKNVTLILKNLGFTTHNFVIEELSIYSGIINPGETDTVSFMADKPGEYEFYCSVAGHRDNGMEGVLIVK